MCVMQWSGGSYANTQRLTVYNVKCPQQLNAVLCHFDTIACGAALECVFIFPVWFGRTDKYVSSYSDRFLFIYFVVRYCAHAPPTAYSFHRNTSCDRVCANTCVQTVAGMNGSDALSFSSFADTHAHTYAVIASRVEKTWCAQPL